MLPASAAPCRGTRLPGSKSNTKEIYPPMYFTIETASGGYRARAYGDNGKLMFWTEVYVAKSSAQHAIDVVKAGARSAPVLDRT